MPANELPDPEADTANPGESLRQQVGWWPMVSHGSPWWAMVGHGGPWCTMELTAAQEAKWTDLALHTMQAGQPAAAT